MKPVFSASVPEYRVDHKPNYERIGKIIDQVISANFNSKNVAIRCLSLQDHPGLSIEDLVKTIEKLGTDKYDPQRRMSVAHDFYTKKGVDIFASEVKVNSKLTLMDEVIKDFYEGALADRGYSLKIDLITIYDKSQLDALPIQYADGVGQDAFRFKYPDKKTDAILGFITIT
jgi:hypothetical protein